MKRKRPYITLDISPGACVLLALTMLILPLRWILAWITAAVVHELGHYIAVLCSGGSVYEIKIGHSGTVMRVGPMNPAAEIFCVAAGPAAGALLLCAARWMPRVALCSCIQTLYNLLPMYPMDGGRILDKVLRWIIPPKTDAIMRWTGSIVLAILLGFAVCCYLRLTLGPTPLILWGFLFLRTLGIKIPCKAERLRVQ